MGKLIPSRLVVVRAYAGGSGKGTTYVFGTEDRQRLIDAGIEAYVKSAAAFGTALMVPESKAAEAREILDAVPDLFQQETPSCPKCHAPHPASRAPFGLFAIAAGLAVGAVAIVEGFTLAALFSLLAAVISAAILESKLPPWRCRSCGNHYGRPSDPKDNVVRFRH